MVQGFEYSLRVVQSFEYSLRMVQGFEYSLRMVQGFEYFWRLVQGFQYSLRMVQSFQYSLREKHPRGTHSGREGLIFAGCLGRLGGGNKLGLAAGLVIQFHFFPK